MKATLREKKIKGDKSSLYLDYYPPITHPETGKLTRREFLSLYIYEKPRNEIERTHNKETRQLGENIRARRQLEIQEGNYGFLSRSKRDADFLAYFKKIAEQRLKVSRSRNNWDNAFLHLSDFCEGNCTFEQVNRRFVKDFKNYLLTCHSRRSKQRTLSPNSANAYFTCFLAVVKEAVDDKLFSENPAAGIENIKLAPTSPEYLTIEELKALSQTHCKMPDNLRRAALFSALSGMRFSDIAGMRWENVRHSKATGHLIEFQIKKTGENSTLPISTEARELLGKSGTPSEKVFPNLDYGGMVSVYIARWALAAGITKPVTFHSFRHSYATNLLTNGVDLYTVSKMLGHKSIQKTQIYARIVDEKKREAANKITLK